MCGLQRILSLYRRPLALSSLVYPLQSEYVNSTLSRTYPIEAHQNPQENLCDSYWRALLRQEDRTVLDMSENFLTDGYRTLRTSKK
jgi:hypothetical protein